MWCETGAGRVRAVGSRIDRASRILVVTAHPDDELLLAPLLGNRCVRGGASCSIVVLTEGENGTCALPEGCAPDLGTVRAAEMTRAAALLNARLTQWTYPDVMANVAEVWDRATIVRDLSSIIAIERPDLILTFDPEHGSTCHPAHREIARLVVETGAPHVFFLETIASVEGNRFVLANGAPLHAWSHSGDWDFAIRIAEAHASQFTSAQVDALRTLPREQQQVWFMPAAYAGSRKIVSCAAERSSSGRPAV